MDKYLDDKEKALVMEFVKHPDMLEAVKKSILYVVYNNGCLKPGESADPLRNFALGLFFSKQDGSVTDEELGRDLRAIAMGIQLLESAIGKMEELAPKKEGDGKDVNPAR